MGFLFDALALFQSMQDDGVSLDELLCARDAVQAETPFERLVRLHPANAAELAGNIETYFQPKLETTLFYSACHRNKAEVYARSDDCVWMWV